MFASILGPYPAPLSVRFSSTAEQIKKETSHRVEGHVGEHVSAISRGHPAGEMVCETSVHVMPVIAKIAGTARNVVRATETTVSRRPWLLPVALIAIFLLW